MMRTDARQSLGTNIILGQVKNVLEKYPKCPGNCFSKKSGHPVSEPLDDKLHPRTSGIFTLPVMPVGKHFHLLHGSKTTLIFLLLIKKHLGCYFQIWFLCYQTAQCIQNIAIPVSSM